MFDGNQNRLLPTGSALMLGIVYLPILLPFFPILFLLYLSSNFINIQLYSPLSPPSLLLSFIQLAGVSKNTREVHRYAPGTTECSLHFSSVLKRLASVYITQQCRCSRFCTAFIKWLRKWHALKLTT